MVPWNPRRPPNKAKRRTLPTARSINIRDKRRSQRFGLFREISPRCSTCQFSPECLACEHHCRYTLYSRYWMLFKINEEQVNRISEFCRVFRNSPHGIEVINTEKSGAEISLIFFDWGICYVSYGIRKHANMSSFAVLFSWEDLWFLGFSYKWKLQLCRNCGKCRNNYARRSSSQ